MKRARHQKINAIKEQNVSATLRVLYRHEEGRQCVLWRQHLNTMVYLISRRSSTLLGIQYAFLVVLPLGGVEADRSRAFAYQTWQMLTFHIRYRCKRIMWNYMMSCWRPCIKHRSRDVTIWPFLIEEGPDQSEVSMCIGQQDIRCQGTHHDHWSAAPSCPPDLLAACTDLAHKMIWLHCVSATTTLDWKGEPLATVKGTMGRESMTQASISSATRIAADTHLTYL